MPSQVVRMLVKQVAVVADRRWLATAEIVDHADHAARVIRAAVVAAVAAAVPQRPQRQRLQEPQNDSKIRAQVVLKRKLRILVAKL